MKTFPVAAAMYIRVYGMQVREKIFFTTKKIHLKMSEIMKQYLAGQLLLIPQILPLFAPTINSYKRLVEGAWAPTTLTWGIDNRTVALRVLTGSKTACRLETRVIGADANPYLAMAGAWHAGLYGIKNKLQLKQAATSGKWIPGSKQWIDCRQLWMKPQK